MYRIGKQTQIYQVIVTFISVHEIKPSQNIVEIYGERIILLF